MRIRLLHHFAGWGIGSLVAILAYLTKNSAEIPGELWENIAVAAKLRPAEHQFPLLWENIVSAMVDFAGLESTIAYLKLLGPISLGLLAALAFFFFAAILPQSLKPAANAKPLRKVLMLAILSVASIAFVCSEPVWMAGRAFSPAIFLTLLSVLVLIFTEQAVTKLTYTPTILVGTLSGILAADTPLGFVPPIFCTLYFRFKGWADLCEREEAVANPIVMAVASRRMWLCFTFFWIAASVVNFLFFSSGGTAEDELFIISIARYLLNYFTLAKAHLSAFTVMVLSAFVLVPLVIAVARMKKLCSPDTLLPVGYGFLFLFAGLFALLQPSGIAEAHFWKWSDGEFTSEYLMSMAMLANSITLLAALSIFAYDIYFRNHANVLRELYPQAIDDDDPVTERILNSYKAVLKPLRIAMPIVLAASLAIIVPFRFDGNLREMSAIINALARTTAQESSGAEVIFTDGSFDAAVETCAALQGQRLKALSMMSKSSAHEIALRTRWETNELRRSLLKEGSAAALRNWYQNGDPCITNIALQVGAELWRQNRKSAPKALGLVMRTAPVPEEDALCAAKKAEELGERILRLRERLEGRICANRKLERLLSFGQWRVSRMCRMRANEADSEGKTDQSEKENKLALKIEDANPQWRKVQEKMDWVSNQNGMRLTPQEGLKLGLERADFRLASTYAKRILESSSDDLKANFAMGMFYIVEKKYLKAEPHLKKCLLKAPNEPAILNNLAIVQMRLGQYRQAETNALKALKFYPESSEIKSTLRHIRSAIDSAPVSR